MIAKIPIQTHIIVLLRNNDFLSWAWGTCDYLLLPPFPINPKKASTIQISIIIWCTCTLSPEVVGSSCWSTSTLYHTYDHALKSFHQSALKSIDIGDAEVLYLWQAELEGQNVREKVHIKFNLESAHKLYNYCNAIWHTASLRAYYMEIAEYDK